MDEINITLSQSATELRRLIEKTASIKCQFYKLRRKLHIYSRKLSLSKISFPELNVINNQWKSWLLRIGELDSNSKLYIDLSDENWRELARIITKKNFSWYWEDNNLFWTSIIFLSLALY